MYRDPRQSPGRNGIVSRSHAVTHVLSPDAGPTTRQWACNPMSGSGQWVAERLHTQAQAWLGPRREATGGGMATPRGVSLVGHSPWPDNVEDRRRRGEGCARRRSGGQATTQLSRARQRVRGVSAALGTVRSAPLRSVGAQAHEPDLGHVAQSTSTPPRRPGSVGSGTAVSGPRSAGCADARSSFQASNRDCGMPVWSRRLGPGPRSWARSRNAAVVAAPTAT